MALLRSCEKNKIVCKGSKRHDDIFTLVCMYAKYAALDNILKLEASPYEYDFITQYTKCGELAKAKELVDA